MSICTKITETCRNLEPVSIVTTGVTGISTVCAAVSCSLDNSGLTILFAATAAIGTTVLAASAEISLESRKIVDITSLDSLASPEEIMLNEKAICNEAGITEQSFDRDGFNTLILIGQTSAPLRYENVDSFECSGGMAYMQDRAIAGRLTNQDVQFYGVFDGHGSQGEDIAVYVKLSFGPTLEKYLPQNPSEAEIYQALKKTYQDLNEQIAEFSYASGTTAAIAVKVQDKVYVANVGDSRIILLKKDGTFEQCSEDAKVRREERASGLTRFGKQIRKNVEKDTTFIERLRGIPLFNAIDLKTNRLKTNKGGHGVNMASVIGDTICPQALREPKIAGPFDLAPGDRLLAASDGVFELLSSSQVNTLAQTHSAGQIGQIAMSVASRHYCGGEKDVDNTTVVIATPIPL